MNDSLFDLPESKSPRLIWMEEHQIRTHDKPEMEDVRWSAWTPESDWDETHPGCFKIGADDSVGFGPTELDAIADLARKLSLKLWNEQ